MLKQLCVWLFQPLNYGLKQTVKHLVELTILILVYFYPKSWVFWITGKTTQKIGLFLPTGFYSVLHSPLNSHHSGPYFHHTHWSIWDRQVVKEAGLRRTSLCFFFHKEANWWYRHYTSSYQLLVISNLFVTTRRLQW